MKRQRDAEYSISKANHRALFMSSVDRVVIVEAGHSGAQAAVALTVSTVDGESYDYDAQIEPPPLDEDKDT